MTMTRTALLLSALILTACGGGAANVKSGPMPSGGTFTGVYHSPQYGEMHMVQNGSAVVGRYTKDLRSGQMQGEADGNLMRFEFTEMKAMVSNRATPTRGSGYFIYMVDSSNDEHVLKGRWGLGDDESGGGEWNAYKSKARQPEMGGSSSGSEMDDDDGDDFDDGDGEGDDFL